MMHNGAGIAEAGLERFLKRDIGNLRGFKRIHKPQMIDEDGQRLAVSPNPKCCVAWNLFGPSWMQALTPNLSAA